jgi:hypothetical protein
VVVGELAEGEVCLVLCGGFCSQQEEEEEVVFWKVRDMAHLLSLEAAVVGETAMLTNIPAAAASVASTSSSPRLSMVAAGVVSSPYDY